MWYHFIILLRRAVRFCCVSQGTQTGSVSTQTGVLGREKGGRFKREGMYVYLWLIHVEV